MLGVYVLIQAGVGELERVVVTAGKVLFIGALERVTLPGNMEPYNRQRVAFSEGQQCTADLTCSRGKRRVTL